MTFPNPPFPPSREAEGPTGPEPLGVAALISTLLPPTTWSFPDPRARRAEASSSKVMKLGVVFGGEGKEGQGGRKK